MKAFYEEPDDRLKQRRSVEYATRFIRPLFPKDRSARILDVGCGYGLFLHACRKAGYADCEGVEQERAFAVYADETLGLKNITTGDLFDFLESKGDDSYDVITAFNIVEHIKKDKVQSFLVFVYRKLKPGGMFIMEVPNADSPLGIHTYFSDLTHEFAFSRKLGVTLLHHAGFSDIAVRYQPNLRNPLIKVAQKMLAKIIGFEHEQMFSGNIVFVGHKK